MDDVDLDDVDLEFDLDVVELPKPKKTEEVRLELAETKRPEPPTRFEDYGQEAAHMMALMVKGYCPHLLLYGPPGVGKTTSLLLLAKKRLEQAGLPLEGHLLEVNASKDNSVEVIEQLVKRFSETKAASLLALRRDKVQRIVLLDEAECMSAEAQRAVLPLLDLPNVTFFVTCNCDKKLVPELRASMLSLNFPALKQEGDLWTNGDARALQSGGISVAEVQKLLEHLKSNESHSWKTQRVMETPGYLGQVLECMTWCLDPSESSSVWEELAGVERFLMHCNDKRFAAAMLAAVF